MGVKKVFARRKVGGNFGTSQIVTQPPPTVVATNIKDTDDFLVVCKQPLLALFLSLLEKSTSQDEWDVMYNKFKAVFGGEEFNWSEFEKEAETLLEKQKIRWNSKKPKWNSLF